MSSNENSKYEKIPYIAPDREIKYVPLKNRWMLEAKKMADEQTGCVWWPTGAVIVKNEKIIGYGSNPAELVVPCPRWVNKCPTGEGYNLCNDVCKRIGYGHSEYAAIENAKENNNDAYGADLYLYGHWWCCKKCWDAMIAAGIKNVYLLKNAENIFTREKRIKLQEKLLEKQKQGKICTSEDIIWK